MNNLLTILITLYPTIFLYTSIPTAWMKSLVSIPFAPFIIFGVIFFIVYKVIKRYISFGYLGGFKRGALGVLITAVLTLGVALIAFYNILPGNTLYNSPIFLDTFLLKNPFTFIVLALPFAYLFFD